MDKLVRNRQRKRGEVNNDGKEKENKEKIEDDSREIMNLS
jgi:hypothetical protein